jgi:hypothetical protein
MLVEKRSYPKSEFPVNTTKYKTAPHYILIQPFSKHSLRRIALDYIQYKLTIINNTTTINITNNNIGKKEEKNVSTST